MTGCNGVFMVPTGFHFEQSRPRNPCGAWAAADCRGIRGFISTTRKFFKNDIYIDWTSRSHQKKKFPATEKNHNNPKYPVFPSDRGPLLVTITRWCGGLIPFQ
jgi:hypothetical protein